MSRCRSDDICEPDQAVIAAVANSRGCDWTVQARGGANIVLGYRPVEGDQQSLGQRCQLDSCDEAICIRETLCSWALRVSINAQSHAVNGIYHASAISVLLKGRFLLPTKTIAIPRQLQSELRAIIQQAIPDIGQHVWLSTVVLMPNLSPPLSPPVWHLGRPAALTVEIKPKCGHLSLFASSSPAEGRHTLKCPSCVFCLTQAHKRRKGKWLSESKFCPVALYSHQQTWRQAALHALLETPQNNLQLFYHGRPLLDPHRPYPAQLASVTDVCSHLPGPAVLVDVLERVLERSQVLSTLDQLQRLGDGLPRSRVISAAEKAMATKSVDDGGEAELRDEACVEMCTAFASRYSARGTFNSHEEHSVQHTQHTCHHGWHKLRLDMPRTKPLIGDTLSLSADAHSHNISVSETIARYVLSSTFKDCSIMIRMPRFSDESDSFSVEDLVEGAQVFLVDMDFKPLSKLGAHEERDRTALEYHGHQQKLASMQRSGLEPGKQ